MSTPEPMDSLDSFMPFMKSVMVELMDGLDIDTERTLKLLRQETAMVSSSLRLGASQEQLTQMLIRRYKKHGIKDVDESVEDEEGFKAFAGYMQMVMSHMAETHGLDSSQAILAIYSSKQIVLDHYKRGADPKETAQAIIDKRP